MKKLEDDVNKILFNPYYKENSEKNNKEKIDDKLF
jgi:hypothetical protein